MNGLNHIILKKNYSIWRILAMKKSIIFQIWWRNMLGLWLNFYHWRLMLRFWHLGVVGKKVLSQYRWSVFHLSQMTPNGHIWTSTKNYKEFRLLSQKNVEEGDDPFGIMECKLDFSSSSAIQSWQDWYCPLFSWTCQLFLSVGFATKLKLCQTSTRCEKFIGWIFQRSLVFLCYLVAPWVSFFILVDL